MNCKDVKHALFDFMDGELPREIKEPLAQHVQQCADCRHAVRFEEQFKARVTESLKEQTMPASLEEKLRRSLVAENARVSPGVSSRLFTSPALSFALAACLCLAIALSVFRPAEPPLTLSQITQALNLPEDVKTHFLACRGCRNDIFNAVLAHEHHHPHTNGAADAHLTQSASFREIIRHIQKCAPCREHTLEVLRAHMHAQT